VLVWGIDEADLFGVCDTTKLLGRIVDFWLLGPGGGLGFRRPHGGRRFRLLATRLCGLVSDGMLNYCNDRVHCSSYSV
jgi:hypothetical protein